MTSKVRRIRYKRRLILRPYIAVKRAKSLDKNTAQVSQAETVEPVSPASQSPADTTTDMDEKTVAQLSDELASFKVEKDPYAYFVSQLPNMLSAIPNLLAEPISQTEDDATDKASRRKSTDELQTAKQETDSCSAWPIADKISTIMPAAVTSAFLVRQEGETAHTYAYKMAGEAEMACQISNSTAKQDKKIAPANKATVQIQTVRNRSQKIQPQSGWSQQFTANVLEEDKCSALSHPEQTVTSRKYDPFKKNAFMPIGIDWNVKQDKEIQDWLSLINPGRRFLWPGLPEKSCQQIRFGGQKESLKSAGVTDPDPDFLFSQLSALAEQRKCSLLWLLLLLSPVDRVRNFLAEQPLQNICRHCLNMPEIALPELTLHYYLKHLLASDQLQVNLACFAQLVPSLILTERMDIAADQLAVFFSRRLKNSEHSLFKLTMKSQVIYIEMKAGQVQIYNGRGGLNVWSDSSFLEHLTLSQFGNNKDISCEIFNLPSDFRQQLASKLQQRELQWQGHWQRHLYEFIISPEALIDTTKLYQ